MKGMTMWINSRDELPPSDGLYEVTNNPKDSLACAVMNYDGIGFFYVGIYRSVLFWRHHQPVAKKYGKLNKEIDNVD